MLAKLSKYPLTESFRKITVLMIGSHSTTTPAGSSTAASNSADAHKNEGFLKSAWHRLTHQHDTPPPGEPAAGTKSEEKTQEEEPKKAASSG